MKPTLFKYVLKMQIKSLCLISLFLFGLIVVFDFAEVSRRMPILNINELLLDAKISFFGAFSTFEAVAHYIYFITATLNLWHLSNSRQMIILKSSGQSPLQILYPFLTCATIFATFWLFVLQPSGIYGDHYCRQLKGGTTIESNENIWIDYNDDNLLFIKKICKNQMTDVCFFNRRENVKIISQNASVENQNIIVHNGIEMSNNGLKSFQKQIIENVMNEQLSNIISLPSNKQSIYNLYCVYNVECQKGVLLKKYEIALQRLLANAFTFLLFALIAAVICFPLNRYKSKSDIVIQVIGIAIIMRFMNNVFETMGYGGVLSPFLAEWIVVLFVSLISIAILIWREV